MVLLPISVKGCAHKSRDRKSTRLNSSHEWISYAVFCFKKKTNLDTLIPDNQNKPYDMHDVLRRVVDDGDFLKVHEHWAENVVCVLARLGGHTVGPVVNQ